jgi:DNA-directed RNA polymerase subunit K/omega
MYELAAAISVRTMQLANCAPSTLEVGVTATRSPLTVAQEELERDVLPIALKRCAPVHGVFIFKSGGKAITLP